MALWSFRKTKIAQADTAKKYAYVSNLQTLLFQNYASPFAAHIVKNMRPIGNINPLQGPYTVLGQPATLQTGYGGVVTGTMIFQPLQNQSTSSGGL
jgi:hypothetical protein